MRITSASSARVVAVIVFLAGAMTATASAGEIYQSTPVPRDQLPYLPQIERFLQAVERADIGTAIEALQLSGDAPSQFKQRLAETVTKLGKSDGYEVVAVRRISPRLHQLYGVIHFDRQPLVFILHTRLFHGAWRIHTVTFSPDPKMLNDLAPLEPVAPASDGRVAAQF